ncbi:unnamed protein product, partial [Mesorhabditis belari]|uniref:RuvB-like helicase n=1 Tax=Mesorhabditis belari TaxID=2138241 RepID=A0AAF3EWF9_9BILA
MDQMEHESASNEMEKSNTRIIELDESSRVKAQERIALHSHLRGGLGLDAKGKAHQKAVGFVGQVQAREAAGVVVELIKKKKFSGRCVLLAGPPGSGKTAIALALSRELGNKVPFVPMTASEVFSEEVKRTEIIAENFRRAIGVRIREKKNVYEGEVTRLETMETENPVSGFGKSISHVIIELKTVKGSKTLKLDPTIYEQILKQRVERGDVIYIESSTGAVKRIGRCDAYATDFDLEADEFVPLPKGDVHKTKEVVQDVTLHDLDTANARPSGARGDMTSIVAQLLKPKKTEITERLRSEINNVVNDFIDQGIAELVPGVLFIDEVHVLDQECFAYLNRALEGAVAPIVILATNRVSDEDETRVMGIPRDLLDRVLLIPTDFYNKDDIREIVNVRSEAESVKLSAGALHELARLGDEQSLRYAVQLLLPSKVLASSAGRHEVEQRDVLDAARLFIAAMDKADLMQGLSDFAFDQDDTLWEIDVRSDEKAETTDAGTLSDLDKIDALFSKFIEQRME